MRNIKNISLLKQQLESIGFQGGLESELYKNICFHPSQFDISYSIMKENDRVGFAVHFDMNDSGDYYCSYYDAWLRKEIVLPADLVDGFSISELDGKMHSIAWCFSVRGDTERLQETARHIAEAVDALQALSLTPQGARIADILKFKHWYGTQAEYLVPALASFKSQYEISQRFYLSGGQGITTEEAYRFLCNRWLEKKLLARRREDGAGLKDGLPGGNVVSSVDKKAGQKRKIK